MSSGTRILSIHQSYCVPITTGCVRLYPHRAGSCTLIMTGLRVAKPRVSTSTRLYHPTGLRAQHLVPPAHICGRLGRPQQQLAPGSLSIVTSHSPPSALGLGCALVLVPLNSLVVVFPSLLAVQFSQLASQAWRNVGWSWVDGTNPSNLNYPNPSSQTSPSAYGFGVWGGGQPEYVAFIWLTALCIR